MRHLLRKPSSEALEAASPPPASTCLINRSSGVAEAASSASGLFFRDQVSCSSTHMRQVHRHCNSETCEALHVGTAQTDARGEGAEHCTALRLAPGSRVVIRRYATLSRGVVEICDLEQQAALVSLEVLARPDIRDRDSYETRAVALALSKLVAEMRAPVSLPGHRDEAWEQAAGTRRASLLGRGQDGEEVAEERRELAQVAAEAFEPAEDCIDRERALEKIRSAMAEESEAARAVLLEGEKSASVAQRLGLSVRQVYSRTEEAMERLRAAFAPVADRI